MANRVLIAGHSQGKYFDQYLKLSNVDVVSFSGYRIEQMWGVIGHRVPDYRIVVLHIGANNLWNDTPADVLTHYQSLIDSIRRVNPSCQILLSGLLPRGQDMFPGKMKSESFLSLVNRKASYLNNKLHNIAKSIPRLNYLGHHYFVADGKLQRHLLSKDGLHLTRDGATTVVRDLEAEIRRQRRPCTPVHFMRLPTMRPYSLNYTQQTIITQQDQPPIPTTFRDALKTPSQYTQPSTHTKPLALNNMVDFPSLPSCGVIRARFSFPSRPFVRARVASPPRARIVSLSRARVVSPSRVRVVSPSRACVVSPSRARVVSPSRARVLSPSRARVVSSSRARVASPARARVVSPVRPPVASLSRVRVVSPSRAHVVSPSRARAASHVYDPDFKPPTAEHVYQYVKAVEHSQFSLANQIRHAKTAQDAKHLSKFIKTSSHWFGIQWFFMYNLSWLNFQQCEQFAKYLISTVRSELLHNVDDNCWGIGKFGKGKNKHGEVLMSLRCLMYKGLNSTPQFHHLCPALSSATSQSCPHVTSGTSQSSPHVTSDTSQSSPHVTSDTSQSSPHVTSETSQSSSHVTSDTSQSSPHVTSETSQSSPHVTSETSQSSPHVTSETSQSSSHVTSDTSQSSPHVTSETSQSSSHVTSDTSPSSPHVTPDTSQSSPHVTSETSQSSSHVTSDTSQSSPHVTSDTSQSSSHVTSDTSQSSPHVTSDTSQSSSHVTSDTSQSSPHVTSDTSQSSSHVTSDTSQSSSHIELSKETIVSILSDPDMSKVTSLPPIKPKADDVFVIESINTEDWKCDQYLWIRDGGRTIKVKDVEIGKVFYKVRIPGTEIKSGRVRPRFSLKFKKVGYWLINRPTLVLVHYTGDETIYTPMAHGNSKNDGEFKRTMPSVIDKVKDYVGSEGAKKVYRTMVSTEQVDGNMQGVANPRNSKQVKNAPQKRRGDQLLSRDNLYNFFQLSSHLDGFVKQLTLYPDLVAVVSLPEIVYGDKRSVSRKGCNNFKKLIVGRGGWWKIGTELEMIGQGRGASTGRRVVGSEEEINGPILLRSTTQYYSDHWTHNTQINGSKLLRSLDSCYTDRQTQTTSIIRPMLLRSLNPCYTYKLTHKCNTQINIPYSSDQRAHITQINGTIPLRPTDPYYYSNQWTHTTEIIGPIQLRPTNPYNSVQHTHATQIYRHILLRSTYHSD
ncbi:unnamed protein product [Mytilus coruscus]|uniref:SGNH hydrolase-type esterase domain-containing protein n=1 Tax=Mytilus coruscus TaxID=42192 RepID=A0A6J8CKG8_MYTCO|nr:unnamed protein product [Mytilus coruscus]